MVCEIPLLPLCAQMMDGMTTAERLEEIWRRFSKSVKNENLRRLAQLKLSQAERKLWESPKWSQECIVMVISPGHV